VPVAGEYVFWIRDYNDSYHPPEARVMTYEIDGREIGRFPSNSVPPGSKGVFAWHEATTVTLTQGSHTMKVIKEQTTRAGGLMDAFFFGPTGMAPPSREDSREQEAVCDRAPAGGGAGFGRSVGRVRREGQGDAYS